MSVPSSDSPFHQLAEEAVRTGFPLLAEQDWKQQLTGYIQELINRDFRQLISLLYRVDVDEEKLRQTLAEQPGRPAAELISDLVTDRLRQKIKTRQQFSRSGEDPPGGEERW